MHNALSRAPPPPAGAGLVRMGAGVREVYPAWWSDASLTGREGQELAATSR